MEIIIPIEVLEAARKTTAVGDKFEAKALELGMEDASIEDLLALYEQVEDEELGP